MTKKLQTAIWDCETDGLLDTVSVVHILVIKEYETGREFVFRNNGKGEDTIKEGVELLLNSECIVGHNIINYDIPVLDKLFGFPYKGEVYDTLVMARLMFSNQKELDFTLSEQGRCPVPDRLRGSHSLEAWGYRLGLHKGDYAKDREKEAKEKGIKDKKDIIRFVWGSWNQEMEDYGIQDVLVTEKLFVKQEGVDCTQTAMNIEHSVARLMTQQEINGFPFDTERASELVLEIRNYCDSLSAECVKVFPGRLEPTKFTTRGKLKEEFQKSDDLWQSLYNKNGNDNIEKMVWTLIDGPDDEKVPNMVWGKRDLSYKDPLRANTVAGLPYSTVKYKDFNPGSRPQVAKRLTELGWKPDEFTDGGSPKVDDVILEKVAEYFPVATPLAQYFMASKRLGQIVDGKNSWINHLKDGGLIHHRVNPCGAITMRASHSHPNLGQVVSVKKKKKTSPDGSEKEVVLMGKEGGWGYECRTLFTAEHPDYMGQYCMVGSDLSGIELRCLAHYMAKYDGGEYGRKLLEEDIHVVNQQSAGLPTRGMAKTFIYAFLYGAGNAKIGSIVDPLASQHVQVSLGCDLRNQFLKGLPALAKLLNKVRQDAERGCLTGLDGRILPVRHHHAALNTLLQSAGAIISKQWLISFDDFMRGEGFENGWGKDYVTLAWVHDEIQFAAKHAIAKEAAEIVKEAAEDVGNFFRFKIPIAADSVIGSNWAETH